VHRASWNIQIKSIGRRVAVLPQLIGSACDEGRSESVHSAAVILSTLATRREPAAPITVMTHEALRLRHAPVTSLQHLVEVTALIFGRAFHFEGLPI
jgi:hypothetical protein